MNCSWWLTNVISASYIPKALRPSSLLSIRIMAADLKWSPLAMMGQKSTKLPFEMFCMDGCVEIFFRELVFTKEKK